MISHRCFAVKALPLCLQKSELMSDQLKHECGIALMRLLKPLEYYQTKYGSVRYALNKLQLLMEKQHNRGQDGAGLAVIKFDVEAGQRYIARERSNHSQALKKISEKINSYFETIYKENPEILHNVAELKKQVPFVGELLLGHLRYGTYGKNSIESCHPFLRQNNWMSRNLVVAGNFNLTNVDEQFQQLIELGQHPKEKADTVTVLEKIGHFLDVQNEKLFKKFKSAGYSNREISQLIAEHLDVADILKQASKRFDGGYVIGGMIGHGDAFILRDPNGIRPCYYIHTDEVFAAASERPALQTAFNLMFDDVKELKPGYAIIIKKDGTITEEMIREPQAKLSCSFERIYFSRGSDANIYRERKELGRRLTQKVLQAIDYDIDNTVFSFIPNTAEVAFLGLVKGVESYINEQKAVLIKEAGPNISDESLKNILDRAARVEKIAIKDAKLRTFITDDLHRDEMVAHIYDVTYGTVRRGVDTLVIVDDSIVRGTTLKQSILKMLDRLGPKKIVVVSSAPQIRYPDCYGIDMAKLADFIAFQAAISLHKKRETNTIEAVLASCAEQENYKGDHVENQVKKIYDAFTEEETSNEIALIMKPEGIQAEVKVVFQSLEDLHLACPNHLGDWYFSGNYPTPGGKKVVNKAFLYYARMVNERAY